jgi:hypothetical protein
MDPLSISFAVLAGAVQIVDMAGKIRTAVETYKTASKEVRSLADKLALVESTCRAIKDAFESPQASPPEWRLLELDRVLKLCLQRVAELDEVLARFKMDGETKKGKGFNSLGTRFLLRESTVKQYNKGLDESLSTLHFMMTTSLAM